MPVRQNKWEYRIYDNEDMYNECTSSYSDIGLSKKEAIWEAKQCIKQNYTHMSVIVKLQTNDREHIQMFNVTNRFGEIIFTKR